MAGVRLDDLLGGSFALVAPEAIDRRPRPPRLVGQHRWSIGGARGHRDPVLVHTDRYIFAAGDDVDDLVTHALHACPGGR